jgi:hypothetical protein
LSSVVLFGVGGVGSLIAHGLAASAKVDELWLFARDRDRLHQEAMDIRIVAENAGNERLRTHAVVADLFDEERTAALIADSRPDVIVNVSTMRSWFSLAAALPPAVWRDLYGESRFGPWLPINLAPALKVMRARALAGSEAATVNVAFPDGVNPVLARLGHAPTLGAGNSETLASAMRIAAAELLLCHVEEVDLSLIGHHYHLANLDTDAAWDDHAFWYRIRHGGEDVTEELNARGLKQVTRRHCPHKSPVPAAASAVKNTLRLLGGDPGQRVHCSSPGGLAGGVDVVFGSGRPGIALPAGITTAQVDSILQSGGRGDGIDEILADGSVRFGAGEAEAMRRRLGYDCPILRPEEAEARGRELLARFDSLAAARRA